jgi:hypothetical protein
VNDGENFGSVFFPVTLLVYGPAAPNVNSIKVAHTHGLTTDILSACTALPATQDCIVVTKSGSDVQIIVWLHQNGGVRGIG